MRTSALRLSVVYAATFATALVALVFVIYLLTARYINAEVDTVIERDALGMLDAYSRSGTRGIIGDLSLRASTFSRINAVYLLTDDEGFVIAGDHDFRPGLRTQQAFDCLKNLNLDGAPLFPAASAKIIQGFLDRPFIDLAQEQAMHSRPLAIITDDNMLTEYHSERHF